MDVHRCRFIDYPPSSINAIAFSHHHTAQTKDQRLRLAIGRGNGNIEIWNPLNGTWIQETVFYGGRDRSIEGLAWTQDPDEVDEDGGVTRGQLRLFSIGSSNAVTEWDLFSGLPIRQSSGTRSEIWCIAAQPLQRRQPAPNGEEDATKTLEQHRRLAIGCADGSIVLLSTADNDLTFDKYVARASERRARALSITWISQNQIAVGFANSSIKIFRIEDGRRDAHIQTISLGSAPRGGPKERLVWALESLSDGTLVSGDSTGEVCWWDRKNYGQTQKIKAHEADVLCLASSTDGRTVYSGGIDRRTVIFRLNDTSTTGRHRWAKLAHKRIHKHDVKTMASFEGEKLKVVVSGGPDAAPTVMPIHAELNENHRRLPFLPQKPPMAGAGRLIVSWWDRQATIWRVRPRHLTQRDDFEMQGYDALARIAFRGEENVTSASLSADGKLLAVSTTAGTKLFRVRSHNDNAYKLKLSKVSLPSQLVRTGARLVQFSPDCRWLLLISVSNELLSYHLQPKDSRKNLLRVSDAGSKLIRSRTPADDETRMNNPWRQYDCRVSLATFSSDSRTVTVSDLSGKIDTWILNDDEDQHSTSSKTEHNFSRQSKDESSSSSDSSDSESDSGRAYDQQWTRVPESHALPRLPSAPIILSFCPRAISPKQSNKPLANGISSHPRPTDEGTKNDSLFVFTATHEMYEFFPRHGEITPWSRCNPSTALPKSFKVLLDRATGYVWDCDAHNLIQRKRIWLYSPTWLCMIDMNQDLPLPHDSALNGSSAQSTVEGLTESRKRKRDAKLHAALQDRKYTAGAGSRPFEDIKNTTNTDRVQLLQAKKKLDDDNDDINKRIPLRGESDQTSEEDLDEASLGLARYRRQASQDPDVSNGTNGTEIAHEEGEHAGRHQPPLDAQTGAIIASTASEQQIPSFFCTSKYRPILGIMPLNSGEKDAHVGAKSLVRDAQRAGREQFLEVALVERLGTDVELPPRFHGGREWQR